MKHLFMDCGVSELKKQCCNTELIQGHVGVLCKFHTFAKIFGETEKYLSRLHHLFPWNMFQVSLPQQVAAK